MRRGRFKFLPVTDAYHIAPFGERGHFQILSDPVDIRRGYFQAGSVQTRMVLTLTCKDRVCDCIRFNDKERFGRASDIQALTLSDGVIMSAAMLAYHLSVTGMVLIGGSDLFQSGFVVDLSFQQTSARPVW